MIGTIRGLGWLFFLGTLAMPISVVAAGCEAKSGNATVALLELYTSEGCNSCPAADDWLGRLPENGFGPGRVVPLALHVDYWNDLGWADRFSQRAYSQRQREYARRWNRRAVYTPGVVLNGTEYHRWNTGSFAADLEGINRTMPQADVSLHLQRNGQTLLVNAAASVKAQPNKAGLYLALYENNLSTEVRAGENQGHRLQHEFVARRLLGPLAFDASGNVNVREAFALEKEWKLTNLGVAAFVQNLEGTQVLQAMALNVCPK